MTRAAPCLFGLDTVVALIDDATPAALRPGALAWPGKAAVTFSDALACVRRRTWSEGFCDRRGAGRVSRNTPNQYGNSYSPRSPRPHDGQRKRHQPSLAGLTSRPGSPY